VKWCRLLLRGFRGRSTHPVNSSTSSRNPTAAKPARTPTTTDRAMSSVCSLCRSCCSRSFMRKAGILNGVRSSCVRSLSSDLVAYFQEYDLRFGYIRFFKRNPIFKFSVPSHKSVGIHPPLHPHRRRCASSPLKPAGETLRLRIALASGWRRWFSRNVLDVAQRLRLRAFRSTAWPSGASVILTIVGSSGRLLTTAMPRRRALPERRSGVLGYSTDF